MSDYCQVCERTDTFCETVACAQCGITLNMSCAVPDGEEDCQYCCTCFPGILAMGKTVEGIMVMLEGLPLSHLETVKGYVESAIRDALKHLDEEG